MTGDNKVAIDLNKNCLFSSVMSSTHILLCLFFHENLNRESDDD